MVVGHLVEIGVPQRDIEGLGQDFHVQRFQVGSGDQIVQLFLVREVHEELAQRAHPGQPRAGGNAHEVGLDAARHVVLERQIALIGDALVAAYFQVILQQVAQTHLRVFDQRRDVFEGVLAGPVGRGDRIFHDGTGLCSVDCSGGEGGLLRAQKTLTRPERGGCAHLPGGRRLPDPGAGRAARPHGDIRSR